MKTDALLDREVIVMASNSWEFVSEYGSHFGGKIVDLNFDENSKKFLIKIRLEAPVNFNLQNVFDFFCVPRHETDTLERFLSGSEISFNFSNLVGSFEKSYQLKLGSVNFIGTMVLSKQG